MQNSESTSVLCYRYRSSLL